MTEARKAAEWLIRARNERGWSTTRLAEETRRIAQADGSRLKLTQQTISNFENKGKRVPEWFRYAEMALADHEPASDADQASGEQVWLQVQLPNLAALKRMFLGALDSIPRYQSLEKDELAERLASRLPALLANASGLLTEERKRLPEAPPARPRSPGEKGHRE